MIPKETDFLNPIIDFVKPTRENNGITGVVYDGGFAQIKSLECNGNILLFRNLINEVYLNDLGGVTLGFVGEEIKYLGNFAGNVAIEIPRYTNSKLGFNYNQVGRIKKPDGYVVWENAYIQEAKKKL